MTASPFSAPTGAGLSFDYGQPAPNMIALDDIANRLSRINCWDDIEWSSYSYAQHALVVTSACTLPAARPYALLQMAPRAYLGHRPIELTLWLLDQGADIVERERRILLEAILPRFGLPAPTPAITADLDRAEQRARATEYRDVVRGKPFGWKLTGQELNLSIRFKPQPKVEEDYRLALAKALRPFGELAA